MQNVSISKSNFTKAFKWTLDSKEHLMATAYLLDLCGNQTTYRCKIKPFFSAAGAKEQWQ